MGRGRALGNLLRGSQQSMGSVGREAEANVTCRAGISPTHSIADCLSRGPMRTTFLLFALLTLQACATTDVERARNAYFVSSRAYQDCVPEYADRLWKCEDYRRTMMNDARRLHGVSRGRL